MVLDTVQLGKGAVDAGVGAHDLVDVPDGDAVGHQRHFNQRVRQNVKPAFTGKFFCIEKIGDRGRLHTLEGAFLVKIDIRPKHLRDHAIVGHLHHNVVIHRGTVRGRFENIAIQFLEKTFVATDAGIVRLFVAIFRSYRPRK